MTIYKNQLPSTTIPFEQFIHEMKIELATNALFALREYENGILPKEYDNYLIFFTGEYIKFFAESGTEENPVFAITKIINEWQPVEINDKIRKFTENQVYNYNSDIIIKIL